MLHRFLTEQDQRILDMQRKLLASLRQPLMTLDAPAQDVSRLDAAIQQLDELFLLVVVGEFNAGKSAFVNALIGERLLEEGVTPTTTQITILKYGETPTRTETAGDMVVVTCPAGWLEEINVVDTPGTNAIIRRHQEITEQFVPRADLVLFVTSVDRSLSESERAFLQQIRSWGKKIVVVLNKIDTLENDDDLSRIIAFVEANARELLGRRPVIYPVSARQARLAKSSLDADERTRLWRGSRFEALEDYILRTLDERERLKLKLANPLGVAQHLTEQYLGTAQARRELLKDDVITVSTVTAQIAAYEADMRRDFKYHLSHVDNVIYAMSERGHRFFDETIRLSRIRDLINADRLQLLFQKEVVADTATQVEKQTRDLIDWMIGQDYQQWQDVSEYINKRVARHGDQMIGGIRGRSGFEQNRQALLNSIGQAASEAVATYDRETEARDLAESVQIAVAQTAIVEVGAIGLGALLVKVLAATVADVTGILAAGAIAVVGLYVIPAKRRRAQGELQTKLADLRVRLGRALTDQFEAELARSLARIRDAMRPYTRFVETQQAQIATVETALQDAHTGIQELGQRIESL